MSVLGGDRVTEKEMKARYNRLLKRFWKGFEYINNAPKEEQEKWLPEFEKIGAELNTIEYMLRLKGIPHTKKEVLEGY